MIKELRETSIPGCYEIEILSIPDSRGAFVKTFHEGELAGAGIDFHIAEQYYSVSKKGVLRGMHFQEPPYGQAKLVTCVNGAFTDVVLDVRKDSPAYGKYEIFRVDAYAPKLILLPIGCAHGFIALEEGSVMLCNMSSVYNAAADGGVRYDSFGYDWKGGGLILSDKDRRLPLLCEYDSPFTL